MFVFSTLVENQNEIKCLDAATWEIIQNANDIRHQGFFFFVFLFKPYLLDSQTRNVYINTAIRSESDEDKIISKAASKHLLRSNVDQSSTPNSASGVFPSIASSASLCPSQLVKEPDKLRYQTYISEEGRKTGRRF